MQKYLRRSGTRRWKWSALVLFLCVLAGIFITLFENHLYEEAKLTILKMTTNESEAFREQAMSAKAIEMVDSVSLKSQISIPHIIIFWMLENQFNLNRPNVDLNISAAKAENLLQKYKKKKEELELLQKSYEAVWADLKYFPVPESTINKKATVGFENSWMQERTFGGKRGHEGVDMMAAINQRGLYPIISATDGVVEKVGWLTQGGYRIGVRSPNGAYFYYAHLYGYAKEFQAGDVITAGEMIGWMGDTGYSEVEGTTGNFDVHLHLGIYIKTEGKSEQSINPFWILKYLEQHKLKYSF